MPQLAQQHWQFGGTQLVDGFMGQRGCAAGHIRGKQAGFREQFFPTRSAQVIEQRQHDHRQVAASSLDTVEVNRQLQNRLHQHFQGFPLVGHPAIDQGTGQLLHFLSQ